MRRRKPADDTYTPSPHDPPPPLLPVVISSTRGVDLLEGELIGYVRDWTGAEEVTIEQANDLGPFTIPWSGVQWRPA
jgi:hypothetical protein